MNKIIKIYDNIIPEYVSDQICELTLGHDNMLPWFYSPSLTFPSNHPEYKFKPGVKHPVYYENTPPSLYLFQLLQPLYCFSLKLNFELHKIFNIKSFLDFPNPNPGPDLPPHVDIDDPHWVLLYYINDSEGDTILFKDDKITEIKRVTPKKGRCIFFDGTIPHCGSTPSTLSRAVINYNFTGKKVG
eukprot:SAG11_NODE_22_length_25040_cov_4.376729_18_plen_186_part_00